MNPASAQNSRVIVGVDDSPGARWALAWAIGEARLRRDPLLIVHVGSLPRMSPTAAERLDPQVIAGLRGAGAQLIARLLDEVSGGPPPGIMTSAISLVGDAGSALVRVVRPSDLLVVGRSTRGWMSRISRPSVQHYCSRHATATLTCVQPPTVDSIENLTGAVAGDEGAVSRRPPRSLFHRLRHQGVQADRQRHRQQPRGTDGRRPPRESSPRPGRGVPGAGSGSGTGPGPGPGPES